MHNAPDLWISKFPVLKPDGHKYDRGVALIYGGAVMTGAARLAARGAQRIGAGMVVLAAPKQALSIYAEALESVIIRETNSLAQWQNLLAEPKHDVVLIGPGLGAGAEQKALVLTALASQKPCVLDADALTNFADCPDELFSKLHAQCVLIPHEGEFQRLFGARIDETADKTQRALRAAKIAGCVVLLKGAKTIITSPEKQFIISDNAPPWLATAGAGDVLAGLILGLIAQKMPIFLASAAAAWLHGDIANHFGLGLIAEDIVAGVPSALQRLLAHHQKHNEI